MPSDKKFSGKKLSGGALAAALRKQARDSATAGSVNSSDERADDPAQISVDAVPVVEFKDAKGEKHSSFEGAVLSNMKSQLFKNLVAHFRSNGNRYDDHLIAQVLFGCDTPAEMTSIDELIKLRAVFDGALAYYDREINMRPYAVIVPSEQN